jgi:hypothetical protein
MDDQGLERLLAFAEARVKAEVELQEQRSRAEVLAGRNTACRERLDAVLGQERRQREGGVGLEGAVELAIHDLKELRRELEALKGEEQE